MARIEKTVFISYRRTNIPWALAIYQNLTHNGYDVFFDYNGIASGDFERAILENINARAHFIVLLTPSALERCGDLDDLLRREIEAALDSQRNVVPLILEGFDFRTPAISAQLTGKLAALKRYNALSILPEFFLEAMVRLRDRYLNVPLDAVLHPVSGPARQAATEQRAAAETAPVVKEEELTAQQWFERGFEAADLDEKLRYYSQAIRMKPDYVEAFNNRGVLRREKGDVEGALEDLNEAIRLKPDFAEAFNNRGIARRHRGDIDGALEDYNEAIRLKPDFADAFNNRGVARGVKGDVEGTLEDHTQAIRLKPDYADAFNNRGVARGDKGDLEGAIDDFSQAIRLKPDDAEAFYNRGTTHDAKGDKEGAIEDYTQAIRLKPAFAEAFLNRGNARIARRDKGDLENALEDFNEATRLRNKPKN